jgi:hypothetical protein
VSAPDLPDGVAAGLDRVAHGDGGRAKALRQSLDRLATGAAGTELQEMAADILAGRVGPRTAMLSEAYGGRLFDGLRGFLEHMAGLSPAEREQLRAAGREHVGRLAAED